LLKINHIQIFYLVGPIIFENKNNIMDKYSINNNININSNNQDNKCIYINNTALTSSIQKAKLKVRKENALRLPGLDSEKREIYQKIPKNWRIKNKSNFIMRNGRRFN